MMVSNRTDEYVLSLCRRHPGRIGCLMGPHGPVRPHPEIPFALDNGAYSRSGDGFNEALWIKLLERTRRIGIAPMWAAVPDVVGNREATLVRWEKYCPIASQYGWPLAFVAQDGMTEHDVPQCASLVFVGGSTDWKRKTASMWCRKFPRVHVGRVWFRWMEISERLGAESCDSTGFFRRTHLGQCARKLEAWLQNPQPHPELNLTLDAFNKRKRVSQ